MGPKKSKKSKAELEEEKLAREEEERKARIAEEKRIAEENEKRRLEDLRIEAEHKAFRKDELERLGKEYIEYVDDAKSREQQFLVEEKQEAARIAWLRFKDPSDEPDAKIDSDMNTFITLTRETEVNDLKESIELIKDIEKVANTVEDVWSDSLARRDTVVQSRALSNLNSLKGLMQEKLDVATVGLLRVVDKHLNDRAEFNAEEISSKLSIGLWASYSDIRPIRKIWQMERMGVKVEIAKQVLQQHEKFMYRVTRIPVVTYNLEGYAHRDAPQSITTTVSTDDAVTAETTPEVGGGDNDDDADVIPQTPVTTTAVKGINTKYVVGDLIQFDILLSPPAAFHLRAKKWVMRDRSVLSTTLRRSPYPSSVASKVVLTVPEDVVMSDDMKMVVWSEEQRDWVEDGITDYKYSESDRLVQFYINTVGTLALVKSRVVDLPYRSWSLKPVLSKRIHGIMEGRSAVAGAQKPVVPTPTAAPAVDGADSLIAPMIKQLSFRPEPDSTAAATIPVGDMESASYEQSARFEVSTQKHHVVIDIVESQCKLVKPNCKAFADLVGAPLTPGSLLARLQRRGVNLLPTTSDLFTVDGAKPKEPLIEDCVLREVARGASALEFVSSAWNQTISEQQVGMLVRESNVYTCPHEENEFECVLVEADEVSRSFQETPDLGLVPGEGHLKWSLVYGNEYGDKKKFSHVMRPDETTHIELIKTLGNRATPECIERYNRINQRFQKTVYTLLSLVKPYSLS